MKNSMMFEGAWVQAYKWQNRILAIYSNCVVLDDNATVQRQTVKSIPYTPEWAGRVMPAKWDCHFAIYKAEHRPGWYLEAKGADLYFEFVHELQLLAVALRLEEEIKSLCNGCTGKCNNKLF